MRGTGALLILLVVSGANAGVWDNFVTGVSSLLGYTEEAPYSVVRTTDNFVERQYPARKWVCTSNTASSRDEASNRSLFMKLFGYITGENSRNETIDMTVPVTTEYTRGASGVNTYTMCFFIGESHQTDPPAPSDETVFLQNRPGITIYTRTVGGYMRSEAQWMEEAANLAELIQEEGISISLNHMYWVGYDAPFKFWDRRNEVWFPAN